LTGPRKRTSQLIGLFSFSLIITTGSPAHSARFYRHHYWFGGRPRRNYSTSVKRARSYPKKDRRVRSARDERAKSLAQRTAWLAPRSTHRTQVSLLPVSRGLTHSITEDRSASDLKAALARRQAWIGGWPQTTNPSASRDDQGVPGSGSSSPGDGEAQDQETPDPDAPASTDAGTVRDWDGQNRPPAPPSPGRQRTAKLIQDALAARGTRYRWGGTSRGGFDCSGFTRYLMARNLGLNLPHSAHAQAHYGQKVALGELREGDLVFFRTYRRGISHVGVYIGDNRFIHAPHTGRSVEVETLTGYYRRRFVTGRRLAGAGPPG
jgi:cell wall-associated NlpC family hydrolase